MARMGCKKKSLSSSWESYQQRGRKRTGNEKGRMCLTRECLNSAGLFLVFTRLQLHTQAFASNGLKIRVLWLMALDFKKLCLSACHIKTSFFFLLWLPSHAHDGAHVYFPECVLCCLLPYFCVSGSGGIPAGWKERPGEHETRPSEADQNVGVCPQTRKVKYKTVKWSFCPQ